MRQTSNSNTVPGIIFAHGNVGEALREAVEGMIGLLDDFIAISNADAGPDEIEERLQVIYQKYRDYHCIFIFIDLFGSSCWKAARLLSLRNKNIRIITGVNLPMLLSFLTKRDRFPVDDLENLVREAGKRGIESRG